MTRYELFRKRIAPILFLGMVALIAFDTCQDQERNRATIVIDVGEARPRVRAVDAELMVGDESFGTFHRVALPDMQIGTISFEARLPGRDAELKIHVDLGGPQRDVVRRIHLAEDGSTITVPIGAELR